MKWIVKQTRKYYNIEPTGHITQQSIVIVIIELACMHARRRHPQILVELFSKQQIS
jgi:hypothetical protein